MSNKQYHDLKRASASTALMSCWQGSTFKNDLPIYYKFNILLWYEMGIWFLSICQHKMIVLFIQYPICLLFKGFKPHHQSVKTWLMILNYHERTSGYNLIQWNNYSVIQRNNAFIQELINLKYLMLHENLQFIQYSWKETGRFGKSNPTRLDNRLLCANTQSPKKFLEVMELVLSTVWFLCLDLSLFALIHIYLWKLVELYIIKCIFFIQIKNYEKARNSF